MRLVHYFFFIICLYVSGCATSIPVDTDYDPLEDFSVLRKYVWHDQVQAPNRLVENRIQNAIDTRLAARGYHKVEVADAADFRVSFTAVAEKALRVDEVSTRMGYSSRRWRVGVSSRTRVKEYNRGTLIIDIIDAAGQDLLWRGVSNRSLVEERPPEEKEQDVLETVKAILQQFPPKR